MVLFIIVNFAQNVNRLRRFHVAIRMFCIITTETPTLVRLCKQ